jgi:hypothetical protein
MPIHHCILEIESFQVGDSSGLYFFWEAEVATKLRYFGDIQFNEQMLLVGVEEMNVRRRPGLYISSFTMAMSTIRHLGYLRTESLSNVLRIAATASWFSAVLVAFNCSTENRQFLY